MLKRVKAGGKYTTESVIEYVKENGLLIIEDDFEYSRNDKEFKTRCISCGNECYKTLQVIRYSVEHNSISKKACGVCNKKAPKYNVKNISDVIELFEKNGYKLISNEYKNARTKLDYICPNGHKNSMTYDNFKRGYRCPDCCDIRNSKGSQRVEKFLEDNFISYEKEKTFKELNGYISKSSYLRFDFFLHKYNLIIEFDGLQHFRETKFFKSSDKLSGTKYRDGIKTKFCLDNGYKIIRISFSQLNKIEDILKSELIDNIDSVSKFYGKEYLDNEFAIHCEY